MFIKWCHSIELEKCVTGEEECQGLLSQKGVGE